MNQACPDRIKVYVPNQFEKIRLVLADYRFVAILEEMADTVVPLIEGYRIPCKQAAHQGG